MADDIKDAGTLAGIVRFGVPWHGRVEGGVLHTGKLDSGGVEVSRAWPQPSSGDCWLVQRPGLDDPYAGASGAARKAQDALEGRELTTWALLSGAGNIHGKAFTRGNDFKHRWLWVDGNGEVFSVAFGLVGGVAQLGSGGLDYDGFTPRDWSFSSPVIARFNIRRYGNLRRDGDPAAETVTLDYTLTAAAMGQDGPAITGLHISADLGPFDITGGNMILRDLSATGHRAIMEIHSCVFDTTANRRMFGSVIGTRPFVSHREYSNPLGFIEFSLSGTGAAPSVSMSVLASRTDALGTHTHQRPSYSLTSSTVCDSCFDLIDTPDMGVVCWYSCQFHETESTVLEYADRIFGYGYDAAGIPQPHKMTKRVDYQKEASVTPTVKHDGAASTLITETTSFVISVEANTHSYWRTTESNGNAVFESNECDSSYTSVYSGNSGVPGENFSITSEWDCAWIYWDFYAPESICGSTCATPAVFVQKTPDELNAEAFRIPALAGEGIMRMGSNLYSVISSGRTPASMGSICLIGRSHKSVAYHVWDATYDINLTRFYGARNPATGEIAFPIYSPVNFA